MSFGPCNSHWHSKLHFLYCRARRNPRRNVTIGHLATEVQRRQSTPKTRRGGCQCGHPKFHSFLNASTWQMEVRRSFILCSFVAGLFKTLWMVFIPYIIWNPSEPLALGRVNRCSSIGGSRVVFSAEVKGHSGRQQQKFDSILFMKCKVLFPVYKNHALSLEYIFFIVMFIECKILTGLCAKIPLHTNTHTHHHTHTPYIYIYILEEYIKSYFVW